MANYDYSLSSDFGGSLDLSHLHAEINASSIGPSCTGVHVCPTGMTSDDVRVEFDSELSGAEETTLNNTVATFPSTPAPGNGPILTRFGMDNRMARTGSSVDCLCMVVHFSEPADAAVASGLGIPWRDETAQKLYFKLKLSDGSAKNVEIGTWV